MGYIGKDKRRVATDKGKSKNFVKMNYLDDALKERGKRSEPIIHSKTDDEGYNTVIKRIKELKI